MSATSDAIDWLSIAIRRHERHMAGEEPTTGDMGGISQKLMMEEMVYAQDLLMKGKTSPTSWYNRSVKIFPDKKSSKGM